MASTMTGRFSGGHGYFPLFASIRFGATQPKFRFHMGDPTGLRHEAADPLDFIGDLLDRKSTRLNSSHLVISYAVFCLKKKILECSWMVVNGGAWVVVAF